MALLQSHQIAPAFTEGKTEAIGLFALKNINTDDTVDLSQWLSVVKRAVLMGGTKNAAAAATVSGTIVTLSPAGLSADGVWLLAWGVAA